MGMEHIISLRTRCEDGIVCQDYFPPEDVWASDGHMEPRGDCGTWISTEKCGEKGTLFFLHSEMQTTTNIYVLVYTRPGVPGVQKQV